MMKNKIQNGFSLIESMIAVVVFSFGLLGVAGIMTVAVKNNHNGYMRSQAIFLSASIVDMMRRNTAALWNDDYTGTYSGYTDVSTMCTSSACDSGQLAARDTALWGSLVTQLLPNSTGEIQCAAGGAPIFQVPVLVQDPADPLDADGNPTLPFVPCKMCSVEPYSGFCDITITWSESNSISADSTQTYTYHGKP